MEKNIIPSISLIDDKPVVVTNGRYEPYVSNGKELGLWEVMDELSDFDKVHLLDLDGIEFNKPQTESIRKIGSRKEVWVDIGARGPEGVTDSFIAGADKTIISTKTIRSLRDILESVDLSDQLVLSIDYKNGLISPSEEIKNMGVTRITELALGKDFDKIIFADLGNKRFDERALRSLPEGDYELFIGGASLDEVGYIHHENIEGYILGLREAIRWQRN